MPRIRGKTRPPPSGTGVVERLRVTALLQRLHQQYPVVWVLASAGAGKTTAVSEGISVLDGEVAWLTLHGGDTAPGRLLTYLEASLTDAVSGFPEVVSTGLASGLRHEEVAGLLAEAVPARPITIVIDELEHLVSATGAQRVIGSFIRWLPTTAKVLLVSRRRISLGWLDGVAGIGEIGETDLAFTADEAGEALARQPGGDAVDAQSAVVATAGWVTGVLFEAWRSDEHVHGAGGETDPLSGYLSSEIMSGLSGEAQDLLVRTSVLDEVTYESARMLGVRDPSAATRDLEEVRVPITWMGRNAFRCHPRFREYLLGRLNEQSGEVIRAVQVAHGHVLALQGRYEDAVESYLDAHEWNSAAGTAERVVLDVMARFDLDVVQKWFVRIPRHLIENSAVLLAADLLLAVEHEEYARGAELADTMLARTSSPHTRDHRPPGLDGPIAWCYFMVNRIDDARHVLEEGPDDPQVRVMQFAVNVELIDHPTHYRDRPAPSGTAVDGMLARIDLAHGRLGEVVHSTLPASPSVMSSKIGALIALGRLDEASAALEVHPKSGWTTVRFHSDLMAELGRPEEAWSALIRGRQQLSASGAGLFRMFSLLAEIRLALRFQKNTPMATAALDALEIEPTADRRVRVVEQVHLWRGLIALLEGDNALAVQRLRQAVAVMRQWDRLLFLPDASIYLAEAEWRLGNVDEADAAADLALETAEVTGSLHMLTEAASQFPSVVARRLDAEPTVDSPWHRIGRDLLHDGAAMPETLVPAVKLLEFGEPALVVDGKRIVPKLTKSLEVLALLCARGGQVPRDEFLRFLFDSKTDDSAKAYLRMAIRKLKEILPADAPLEVSEQVIVWRGGGLSSESEQVFGWARRSRRLPPEERLAHLMELLERLERDYFPNSTHDWFTERRMQIRVLAVDLRYEAAEAAFDVGELALADHLAEQVIATSPYRESAWRLRMKVAGTLGHSDLVLAHYEACCRALDELPTKPAESTQALLQRLRR